MSLREERIKRRLKQRPVKGKEYKALAPVGRPLPGNGEGVAIRADRARRKKKKKLRHSKKYYVPSTDRVGYDESLVEVVEPVDMRFRKNNVGKRRRDK